MKDFQRGWYWHLILLMTRSKPLGYLPHDGQLWTLAGSHTKQYFERHAGLVLECFKVSEFDGRMWIYSEPLLKVLNEQQLKHDQRVEKGRLGGLSKQRGSKQSLNSYSLEFKEIWEKNTWNCVSKKTAYKAFNKALEDIEQEKKITRDQAIEFLADAMEEFKTSPAGKDNGLFETYQPPYPATWLNGQRYFDERKNWWGKSAGANGKQTAAGMGGPQPAKSLTEADCAKCEGTGWDRSSGKAAECECRRRNKAHAASAAGTK